jgi:penicillin-binding protein 2
MAAATTTGTAAASHIEGVDFAGKTGTAQVVGGGDTHVKGGARTPNSWFVGMVPRRNPELAIVVLQEHGDWGANSAHIAQAVVTTYVNKERRRANNLLQKAGENKPVEVGAVWTVPDGNGDALRSGHFLVTADRRQAALQLKSQNRDLGMVLGTPLRFRERRP